jgi:hypothetical protein
MELLPRDKNIMELQVHPNDNIPQGNNDFMESIFLVNLGCNFDIKSTKPK